MNCEPQWGSSVKKILELAAKYWPETGKWLVGAMAFIAVVNAIKFLGIPIEDYGKIGATRVFDFFEQHFPSWSFVVLGIALGRLFLGGLHGEDRQVLRVHQNTATGGSKG